MAMPGKALVVGVIPRGLKIDVPEDCSWWRVRCSRGVAKIYMRRGVRFEVWALGHKESSVFPAVMIESKIRGIS